jgi:hypothetical protein
LPAKKYSDVLKEGKKMTALVATFLIIVCLEMTIQGLTLQEESARIAGKIVN